MIKFFWMTIGSLVFGFAAIGTAAIGFAISDRKSPIDYIDASASSPTVTAGGTIDVHFDVYRHRICQVIRVARILTDETGVEHAISNYTLATQTRPGRESYDRTITIPDNAAVGDATYEIRITYACNFLHNLGWPIQVNSPKIHFEITPSTHEGFELTPLPPKPGNPP